MKTSFLEST